MKVVSVRSCDAEAVLKSQTIINNHNNLPNSKTTLRTPAEIITGEKFNFLADLQAPFGSVILVNHIRSDNKANEIGICLGASHGTKGGIWVFVPNVDKEPKVRRRIQGMPMSQEFIILTRNPVQQFH